MLQKTTTTLNYFKIVAEALKHAIERFLNKISVSNNFYNNTPCWDWTAYKTDRGYGIINIDKNILRSHRVIYEYFYGKLNPNLDIHHKCKNRKCVNPLHLEAVTAKENTVRGMTGFITGIKQRLKTHCKYGHIYTEKNTYIKKNGSRKCRNCARLMAKKYLKIK